MTIIASFSVPSPFLYPHRSFKAHIHFLFPVPSNSISIRCNSLKISSRQTPFRFLNAPKISCEASPYTRQPTVPPYNVLITGSTKGIGYALAKEFIKAGDNVVICSRSAERVESAVEGLREELGKHHVWGTQCDIREGQDVKDLVAFAQRNLGYIDIWINNAGSNAYSFKPLAEASDEDLIEVVSTNALGLMICCREAIKMMLDQPRGGHIFNIDGAGSDGRPTPKYQLVNPSLVDHNPHLKLGSHYLCHVAGSLYSSGSASRLLLAQSAGQYIKHIENSYLLNTIQFHGIHK